MLSDSELLDFLDKILSQDGSGCHFLKIWTDIEVEYGTGQFTYDDYSAKKNNIRETLDALATSLAKKAILGK